MRIKQLWRDIVDPVREGGLRDSEYIRDVQSTYETYEEGYSDAKSDGGSFSNLQLMKSAFGKKVIPTQDYMDGYMDGRRLLIYPNACAEERADG